MDEVGYRQLKTKVLDYGLKRDMARNLQCEDVDFQFYGTVYEIYIAECDTNPRLLRAELQRLLSALPKDRLLD